MATARQLAVANENRQIEESAERAAAAAKPRTALEALANRLSVTPQVLQNTLKNTVFKGCSDAEFVALVIVANEYALNPLLREIYAMPKKGGGIQAIVGYDGWIKIANSHPQFDGYEAVHYRDAKGVVEAVEGVVYRKDRSHPTKKTIYLKEFKRGTDPWNNSPNHMLDVRGFCQTIRLALGVALGVEGDENIIDGGEIQSQTQSLPSRQTAAEALDDEIPALNAGAYDQQTGEIIDDLPRDTATGMTEVSEETARALDANDGTLSPENPTAAEGPADEDRGEAHVEEAPAWAAKVKWMKDTIGKAKNGQQIKEVEGEYLRDAVMLPQEVADEIEGLMRAKRAELSAARAQGGENGQ